MFFNSYVFIFVFLPLALVVVFNLARFDNKNIQVAWLIFVSLVFYGSHNTAYLFLLCGSVFVNFFLGELLQRYASKPLLAFGVAANLFCLGYYKYAGFFLGNLNVFVGTEFFFNAVALPLAISFFTFQQIAYLVDVFRGKTGERSFLHYFLFVVFFPQLIIGPIVKFQQTVPQFQQKSLFRFQAENLSVGSVIFIIGLLKKVIIADTMAMYANPGFDMAAQGGPVMFLTAWTATIGFCFQVYFDFSSYSDMAVGIARMFGIKLPVNFDSPLRQTCFTEFWRTWHMTLNQFFRVYVFFPLGGPFKGRGRMYCNIAVVIVLAGIWHGAGWNFFCLGWLFTLWILIELEWKRLAVPRLPCLKSSALWAWTSRILTFLAFNAGLPFFRSVDFSSAIRMYKGMLGLNGFGLFESIPAGSVMDQASLFVVVSIDRPWAMMVCYSLAFFIVWFLPNTQNFMRNYAPALGFSSNESAPMRRFLIWSPTGLWSVVFGLLSALLLMGLGNTQEFIYFEF